MHYDFLTPVWTVSDGGKVTLADNTDLSVSGTSKKISFANGLNEYATLTVTSVDPSMYEEMCFYIYTKPQITREDLVKVTVGGQEFTLNEVNEHQKMHMIRIDAAQLSTITTIKVESLVANLVVFFDLPILRKVTTADMDKDILSAIAEKIDTFAYGVSTTLSRAAAIGAKKISLTSRAYVFDNSVVTIAEGIVSETVELTSHNGDLKKALENAFSTSATVTVTVPVRYGRKSNVAADPAVGVIIADRDVVNDEHVERMQGGRTKLKELLGAITVQIYVECTSEGKTLDLARQFERDYGDEFEFLLDGERVDAIMTADAWIGRELGGMARQSYLYEIRPQPLTIRTAKPISTITLDMDSEEAS